MKQTKASGSSPSPADNIKGLKESGSKNTAFSIFGWAVLDLSWQLAIVVLVPIIGGFELDQHIHTTPLLTITGFVLAMLGTYAVIRKMLSEYNERTISEAKRSK